MTVRLIVRTMDGSFGCLIGGPGTPAAMSYATFDIDVPELEKYLRRPTTENWTACTRAVVGAELKD